MAVESDMNMRSELEEMQMKCDQVTDEVRLTFDFTLYRVVQ